jgi:hypothetical protein
MSKDSVIQGLMEVDWRDLDMFFICSVIDYICGEASFEDSVKGRLVRRVAELIMPLECVDLCTHYHPMSAQNRGNLPDMRMNAHQSLIDTCSEIRTLAQIRKVNRIHNNSFSSRTGLDRSGMFSARKLPNGLYDFQQAAVDHITHYNDKYGSIVVIGTGLGKTHVMATSICNIGLPTGISVPSGLVRQTCGILKNLMSGWTIIPVESHMSLHLPQSNVVLVVSHALLKTNSSLVKFLANPVVMIDESHLLKDTMLINIWQAKPDWTCIGFFII